MKRIKFIIIAILVILPLVYYACDDSGQEPVYIPKGQITFTQTNLKTIDPAIDGYYQLWVRQDSLGSRYYSLGEFNIAANGSVVNLQWQPMTFRLPPDLDTNSLGSVKHAIVTIEHSLATTPSNRKLISGNLSINDDSLWGGLDISGSEALGNTGYRLKTLPPSQNYSRYILYTPSNDISTCKQGAWFCDTNFNAGIPSDLALPSNFGWIYEGWIKDKHDQYNIRYYSMGRFFNPYAADLDGAGPCSGPNSGFNVPGQDFIQTTGNCPIVTNLADGLYEIFITLEPFTEKSQQALNLPFYLKLFVQDYISPSIPCKREDYLYSQYPTFPTGWIKITN